MEIYLANFDDTQSYFICNLDTPITPETQLAIKGVLELEKYELITFPLSGKGALINSYLHSIFTHSNKNYIYLKDRLIRLSPSITIDYYCGEEDEASWFKIYESASLIYEITYQSTHPAFYNEFDGLLDWEIVNFAYVISTYIDKVNKKPAAILFPTAP